MIQSGLLNMTQYEFTTTGHFQPEGAPSKRTIIMGFQQHLLEPRGCERYHHGKPYLV